MDAGRCCDELVSVTSCEPEKCSTEMNTSAPTEGERLVEFFKGDGA